MGTTQADRLRAFGRMLRDLTEAVAEAGVEQANQLDALIAHARAGRRLHGRRLTQVDPIVDQRVSAAATAFAKQALAAIDLHRSGDLTGPALQQAIRGTFVQQGRRAFLAGKRSLGNLSRITLQDERDIADQVDHVGLTPGVDGGTRSLGGVVGRIVAAPPQTEAQKQLALRIDDAMGDYVAALVRNELRAGIGRDILNQNAVDLENDPRLVDLEAAEGDQTVSAKERIAGVVSDARRRYLAGTMSVAEATALVMGAMESEARRAYARGHALRQQALNTLDQLGDYETALDDTETQVAAPLEAAGVSLGEWYALLVAATALSDSEARNWLTARLSGMAGVFHSLSQAGQMAAFRDGTPSPAPEDSTSLPGAAYANEQPGPLEENIVVWWNLDPEAKHCIDCIRLSDMSPFDLSLLDTGGIYPGSGHTRCDINCLCFLVFEQPDTQDVPSDAQTALE